MCEHNTNDVSVPLLMNILVVSRLELGYIMLHWVPYSGMKLLGQSCAVYFLKVACQHCRCSTFLLTLLSPPFLPDAVVSSLDFHFRFPDEY